MFDVYVLLAIIVVAVALAFYTRMRPVKSAAVMLILKDGLILAVSRRENTSVFGLPGGKVELGETPREAAIRETFEETGIKVKHCFEIYKRLEPAKGPKGYDFYTHCFYASEWEGTPANSDEGVVDWLTTEDLIYTKAAFAEYNRNTLEKFKRMYPGVVIK